MSVALGATEDTMYGTQLISALSIVAIVLTVAVIVLTAWVVELKRAARAASAAAGSQGEGSVQPDPQDVYACYLGARVAAHAIELDLSASLECALALAAVPGEHVAFRVARAVGHAEGVRLHQQNGIEVLNADELEAKIGRMLGAQAKASTKASTKASSEASSGGSA